jgi:hypothetical protein
VLTVVCWRWRPFNGYRSSYGPETVNTLQAMVKRHYPDPHRFVCCTDDARGLHPDVEVVPIWNDYADLQHPHSHKHPSCYRRLKAFAPEIRDFFGKRFVSMDLDCVIVDDLRPLWNREEEFVAWGGTTAPHEASVNGSMFLLTAGSRPRVWKDFNPRFSPTIAKKAGFYGSDQAWIGYCLGHGAAKWTTADGVYSYRLHVEPARGQLPKDARIVFFNGKKDPWSPDVKRLPWVMEHWR